MANTKEADPKRKGSAKKGLHGWKAALAVFGCGTLAAFGFFGAIVGILTMFLSTVSSGISDPEVSTGQPGAGIGAARSGLSQGQMNVCAENLDNLSSINAKRQDNGEYYVDTTDPEAVGIDRALRVVRDDCVWDLTPSGSSTPWYFGFSYEAIIDAEAGEDRDEIASDRFQKLKPDLLDSFENVESENNSPFAGPSYSVYGIDEAGNSVYAALIQTRSAVYIIRLEDSSDISVGRVGETEFLSEARKIESFLRQGFEYWIPE